MLGPSVRPPAVALLGGEGLRPESTPLWQQIVAEVESPRIAVIPVALSAMRASHAERRAVLTKTTLDEMGMETHLVEPADQSSDALKDASLVYLSGGEVRTVCGWLAANPMWQSILTPNSPIRMLVASGAAAVALGQVAFAPIKPVPARLEELSFDRLPGLALLRDIVILPYLSSLQDQVVSKIRALAGECILVGIDDQAALISRPQGWEVAGLGTASIIRTGMSTATFDSGMVIPADVLPPYS